MIIISSEKIDEGMRLRDFSQGVSKAKENQGAIVSFIGKVRPAADKGEVRSLFLQHHPALTERTIETFVSKASSRWPISKSFIYHRIGEILPNESIVMVAVASAHRRAAFEAADFLMDYLKTDAMFWKKEMYKDGSHSWIDPRDEDYQDMQRWTKN